MVLKKGAADIRGLKRNLLKCFEWQSVSMCEGIELEEYKIGVYSVRPRKIQLGVRKLCPGPGLYFLGSPS